MAVLSSPDGSCLLLLDIREEHADALLERARSNLQNGLVLLRAAADLLQVPLFVALPASVSDTGAWPGKYAFRWPDGSSP
jgi:hypothetical protein